MNVLMLTGSPNPNGATTLLADEFCKGLAEKQHEIERFNVAKMKIHYCVGCKHCRKSNGVCVYKDDMTKIYPSLLKADALVIVTPIYYFHMTGQMKTAIDRFYALHPTLKSNAKKVCLLSACGNNSEWAMDAISTHFEIFCRYLQWENSGTVLAKGCYAREDIEKTDYPQMARHLGAKI